MHVVAVSRTPQGTVLACRACQATALVRTEPEAVEFMRAHEHPRASYGLGDLVAGAIKRIAGIEPCTPCERRRQALNRAVPLGWRR